MAPTLDVIEDIEEFIRLNSGKFTKRNVYSQFKDYSKKDINIILEYLWSSRKILISDNQRIRWIFKPRCDYHGTCKNGAYREVYPSLIKGNSSKGWSYLCKKHFSKEKKRYKGNLPHCSID